MNKTKISTNKNSLINNIGTPLNYPRNYTPEITESGTNTHIVNEAITTMEPSIVSNNMNARIPYGRKMESPYVETLQIPGLTKKLDKFTLPQK